MFYEILLNIVFHSIRVLFVFMFLPLYKIDTRIRLKRIQKGSSLPLNEITPVSVRENLCLYTFNGLCTLNFPHTHTQLKGRL